MARIKEAKPRPKKATKWVWGYENAIPEAYDLPEGAQLQTYEADPDAEVICADCGRAVTYKWAHPSPLIRHRRKGHVGYLVCGACYFREKDEHRRIIENMIAAKAKG